VNTVDSLSIVPTGAALAAEVRGIDLSLPVSGALAEALREAWHAHLVLLFRDQSLSDDTLMRVGRLFGGTIGGGAHAYYRDSATAFNSQYIEGYPEVLAITNLGEDGQPCADNGGLGSHEVVWHSDNSYVEIPPAGSLLYALEIPTGGGGNTSFNNQYLAYEQLPEDLKRAIEGRSQVHDTSRNSAGVLRPGVEVPRTPSDVKGPAHPLVRVHPKTGKRALYLGRRRAWPSNYIIGMPDEESETLLDELWSHATRPALAWEHVWRVGDAVLWDNRCAMHYRTPIDPSRRRVMHRIQIKGEAVVAA
jgi:taurine dioxygenase